MAAAPDKNFPLDENHEGPLWLGSMARRGAAQEHGAGWKEDEIDEIDGEDARPKWLGSVARREGSRSDDSGWVDPEEAERPAWLGSAARRGVAARSLVLIDMETEPSEPASSESAQIPQEAQSYATPAPGLAEILKPSQSADELEERRQPNAASGELGMHLRVA
jgi:SLT domain-containing protein